MSQTAILFLAVSETGFRNFNNSTNSSLVSVIVMVERLLPSDDPVAEEVLEWTIKRDAQDIAQLMEWLIGTTARKDREMLINRALDLMEEIDHALKRLDELR
ncbi:MAG: hypothetical protein CM15mP6_3800 [Methanobacteriota archaeon]|jgi:hypothetical protein|nr:MAG: hypothetical protein CM15mP6_3800 [Euryarchaeota archaeon]